MSYVKVVPFRGLCNQLGAICWAIGVAKNRKLKGVWIDGMVLNAEDPMKPRVKTSLFLNLNAMSKTTQLDIVETLPKGKVVVANLGVTKYSQGYLKTFASLIVFADTLVEKANKFISSRLKPSYSAVHLRIEKDMLKHLMKVLRWRGNIRGQLVERYKTVLDNLDNKIPLFVASNFGKTRRTVGVPIPATEGFQTVQTPGPKGKASDRDLRAVIDFIICVQADVFVGVEFSSFSRAVSFVRESKKKPTLWIRNE